MKHVAQKSGSLPRELDYFVTGLSGLSLPYSINNG